MKYSIIIPVAYNREAPIIESIQNLDFPKDEYEVIVKRGDNPSINRNKAIDESKAEILAFVDDDASVKSNWLTKAEDFFNKYPSIDIVGGPQLTPSDDGVFARQSGYVFSSYFCAGKMSSRYKMGRINLNADELNLTSTNIFMKKNVFKSISHFNPELFPNEETELIRRAIEKGVKVAYCPDIIVYHKRRDNFISYLKQCFNYGLGRATQDVIAQSSPQIWILIPILFFLYVLFIPFLYTLTSLTIIPAFLYLGISLLNAIYISVRNDDGLVVFTYPILCFSIHLAYPLGYMCKRIKLFLNK
jgi:GT2 family glycosyltransferase|tara:strand:- start:8029 stop:8934 length:906 start_codon:yes stop_codon:yes gene_type:complete